MVSSLVDFSWCGVFSPAISRPDFSTQAPVQGDVTIASEGLHKLGLCSAHMAFEQGGIFIVSYLL
jgi:hypothetical protein